MALVSVGIVCWNAERDIADAIRAVRAQTHAAIELRVADNASTDGTRALLASLTAPHEQLLFDRNTGFSAAHNALIARSTGDYYLALNPDVVLEPAFVERVTAALEADPRAGAAAGKLLRLEPADLLDSTGIVMTRSQRHLDRGAGERDSGQYDTPEDVFGVTGAAATYRRAMLDDTRVGAEYFDEDFFAYREDADLAWRAQVLGWRCLYVPTARARHRRVVTPERRSALPADINAWSVRNRFLLRVKNQTIGHALRFALPALVRDAQVVGYVLLRERTSLAGLADVVRLLPRMLVKRRSIMARRRASDEQVARWFTARP